MTGPLFVPSLDTGEVIVSSDLDGIHLEASEQKKLGRAVAAKVRELLGHRQCVCLVQGSGVGTANHQAARSPKVLSIPGH